MRPGKNRFLCFVHDSQSNNAHKYHSLEFGFWIGGNTIQTRLVGTNVTSNLSIVSKNKGTRKRIGKVPNILED
jgi:hypothetical protein